MKGCAFNINPLSASITKWSNTLKQIFGKLPTNCLSVFDHFVGLALKGLKNVEKSPCKRPLFIALSFTQVHSRNRCILIYRNFQVNK